MRPTVRGTLIQLRGTNAAAGTASDANAGCTARHATMMSVLAKPAQLSGSAPLLSRYKMRRN
jgi:hypothetical protein